MSEFTLIERFFNHNNPGRKDVLLGIGDDAAIVQVPKGKQLAITTDTLVAGNHFLPSAPASFIAHKALASNISDLAAMGAQPAWVSLALTLPSEDEQWLEDFCQSFFALANVHNIALIGGDTTKGPLAITITLHGFIEPKQALLREGAKAGDLIFVSGSLGDSAAGLKLILEQPSAKPLSDNEKFLIHRHFHKTPRVELGLALRGIASSCLDISDGLGSDLQHILNANKLGAKIQAEKFPLSDALIQYSGNAMEAAKIALTSGEEYELCFTLAQNKLSLLNQLHLSQRLALTCIGKVVEGSDIAVTWQGKKVDWSLQGWDHFIKQEG